MAGALEMLQGLLDAAGPLAGSFTPRPYPGLMPAPGGLAAGNAFAGLPGLAQAGPPGMAQPQPGAGWMQPMPQQSAGAVDLQQLIKLLRDAGIGPAGAAPLPIPPLSGLGHELR